MKLSRSFLAAGAMLILSATEASASCYIGQFIGPRVCGTASVRPYIDGSQTPTPLLDQENGAGVSVGSAGGGLGSGGLVQATGTIGEAHIFASSFTEFSVYRNSANATGVISFVDGFTVGSGGLNLQFTSSAEGTFLGFGATGNVYFNLYSVATNSLVLYNERLFVYEGRQSQIETYKLFLGAGNYLFDWSMEGNAGTAVTYYGNYLEASVDMRNTGSLKIDVLTPGQSLTFLSGTDYSSVPGVPAVVPEPATWALMLLGFGGIGSVLRRRRSRAALAS